ncbi:MAG: hypothetical protein O2797_02210 [Bacteroidetes bacterium]|nr:hypothetical protein [Bacteroidota bacterium]MDA1333014.1 hypothetical protein [Bacteroidota bacterium]
MRTSVRQLPVRLLIPLLSFFLIAGCDDPSNVGQGLVDSQAGETRILEMDATSFEANELADLTGGNTASGSFYALFGQVDDPVAGNMIATGVVDFVPESQFSTAFTGGIVNFAELQFNIEYLYGDTTSAIQFELLPILSPWESSTLRSDSTIQTGTSIATYSVAASKGITKITLPQSWVSNFDQLLRSSGFSDEFHGFIIQPIASGAIAGIRFTNSQLRATAVPGDTTTYVLSKVGTLTAPLSSSIEDVVLLHDAGRSGLDIRFPIAGSESEPLMIHRVRMAFQAMNLADRYPTGFVRSFPASVGLRAVSNDGLTRLDILEVPINADGAFSFDNGTLTNIFQSANLEKSVLDRFEIYLPTDQSGVGFLAFPATAGLGSTFPTAELTVTPIN